MDTEMADWLSISRVEEVEGGYPSSPMNWRIQMISLAASTAAMYSASVVVWKHNNAAGLEGKEAKKRTNNTVCQLLLKVQVSN